MSRIHTPGILYRGWLIDYVQVSEGGLGMGIEEKLAALELESHLRNMPRAGSARGGVVRPPAAMDDMLYGSSDSVSKGIIFRGYLVRVFIQK